MTESADGSDGTSSTEPAPVAASSGPTGGRLTRRGWLLIGVGAVLATVLVGWLVVAAKAPKVPTHLVIGAASIPESQIVAEIYSVVLEQAGIVVDRKVDSGVREQFTAELAAGTFDLASDNIGILTEDLNHRANGQDAPMLASGDVAATTEQLRSLVDPLDVTVVDPAPATSGIGFAVSKDLAKSKDLKNLSDLAKVSDELVFGGPVACETSQFCLPGLKETYGITFKKFKELDLGGPKTLNALSGEKIDVGIVTTTNPSVDERDLVILKDDKQLQVAQNVTAIMRSSIATPEIQQVLNDVNAKLTTDELRALDGRVTIKGLSPEYVAADWAFEQGLIPEDRVPAKPSPTPSPTSSPPPPPPPPAPAPPSYRNRGEPSGAATSQNWDALAQCESGGSATIVSSGGSYHGLYQFSDSTWQAMGGSGSASDASAAEQTYRAQLLWDASGPGQWPSCGGNL